MYVPVVTAQSKIGDISINPQKIPCVPSLSLSARGDDHCSDFCHPQMFPFKLHIRRIMRYVPFKIRLNYFEVIVDLHAVVWNVPFERIPSDNIMKPIAMLQWDVASLDSRQI